MTCSVEEPFYFGAPGEEMLGVLYRPGPGTPSRCGGWLLAPPFSNETGGWLRLLVEWARVLCGQGFHVLRFDYRGNGNSAGSFHAYAAGDFIDDVNMAGAELERRSGVPWRGTCGLRIGATLGAAAAAKAGRGDLALVLWEPLVKGADYADELLRMVVAGKMTHERAPVSRAQLREHLAAGRMVPVHGYCITDRFYHSLADVDVDRALETSRNAALVVHMRKRPSTDASMPDGPGALSRVEHIEVDIPLPWVVTKQYSVHPAELFEPTLEWILRHTAAPTDPPARAPSSEAPERRITGAPECPSMGERLVTFSVDGKKLRGILSVPPSWTPARPAVVFPWMSFLLYIKLHRALAAQGWAVLRFDPQGRGDSEGGNDYALLAELWNATENGLYVPDSMAAMDFLEQETGARSFIVSGICGDAVTALIQGAGDPRVAGVAPLELAMLYTPSASVMPATVTWRRSLLRRNDILSRIVRMGAPVRRLYDAARQYYWHYWNVWRRLVSPDAERINWVHTAAGALANTCMLDALARCIERSLPMLFIFAPHRNRVLFENILPELRRVYRRRIDCLRYAVVSEADHVFSDPAHTADAARLLLDWLNAPQQPWAARAGASAQSVVASGSHEAQRQGSPRA